MTAAAPRAPPLARARIPPKTPSVPNPCFANPSDARRPILPELLMVK